VSFELPAYLELKDKHLLSLDKFTSFNRGAGPTNAFACNKTLIQMTQTKTLKITPTCFDDQMIIIRELFDPG
jgi:hypothetical protein